MRVVPRSSARAAIAKAEEFLAAGESALGAAQWNACGLDAVHAGISAADAALAAAAGLRSVAADHGYVVHLLESNAPEFAAPQRRHMAGLLQMKNTVAYENRLISETEARQLLDHARRFVRWARRVVGDAGV
ncbi:MAG: hypothetical protein CVT60_05925 [Actinobacteria bacterium HGW-Actinobacteria-10]|nr:MAG: hypothetical protein CVT60_05925 [Actinobacteria bacterium HGW-Actinobacteria-10]